MRTPNVRRPYPDALASAAPRTPAPPVPPPFRPPRGAPKGAAVQRIPVPASAIRPRTVAPTPTAGAGGGGLRPPSPRVPVPLRGAAVARVRSPFTTVQRQPVRLSPWRGQTARRRHDPPAVIQRMEWQSTTGAVETTNRAKGHQRPWIWAPDLNVLIANVRVAPHAIHTKNVTPSKGTKGNKLWASYTLVWCRGGQPFGPNTASIQSGPVLGPVEAKLSPSGKHGHTEQQIGAGILSEIETPLTAPTDDDLVAIIIEIHQTNTPCSGQAGCARYLENQIM